MRYLCWVAALAVGACGGDGGTDTGGSGTDVGGDDDDNQVVDCNSMPQYDLNGLGCEELASAYTDQARWATFCTTAADCRAIHPACEHWDDVVGCYWVVNSCFTDAQLQTYNSLSEGCVVTTGSRVNGCECGGVSPPQADCIDGECQMVLTTP